MQIEPEELYWAMLDTTSIAKRPIAGHSREQLGYLFERLLPLPIEDVQAAYVNAGSRCVVACAMERHLLEEMDLSNELSLTPKALPHWMNTTVDPNRLNLLTGRYVPVAVRRRRSQLRLELAAALLLAAGAVLLGAERRIIHARHAAIDAEQSLSLLYEAALGPAEFGAQPAALRLTGELRRLRQTRGVDMPAAGPPSAASALAAILAEWPRGGLEVRAEAVTVTETVITIVANLADNEKAEQFSEHFRDVEGWSLQQPQVRVNSEQVRVTLRFSREDAA